MFSPITDDTCFNGNGENYRGTTFRTVSRSECAPWHEQVFYKTADYPELIGGHNYCRNPGGMESQPWCFVRDPEMRKVHCDVPKCGRYTLYAGINKVNQILLHFFHDLLMVRSLIIIKNY